MAFPAVSAGALPAAALGLNRDAAHATAIPATAAAPHVTPGVAHAASLTPSSSALPGQTLKGAVPVDTSAVSYRTLHETSLQAKLSAAAQSPTLAGAAPAPAASPSPMAPHPGVYIATGSFSGYVYDRETGKAITGATVEAFGANGQLCPPSSACPAVSSTANGSFTVNGPVGFDYIRTSAPYYLDNITYSTAGNGTRTNVGTVYLVESAICRAIIKSDTPPTDVAVSGVQASDAPVDYSVFISPVGTSLSNGSVQFACADSPSIASFTPPAGLYLSNFTWVNGTPGKVVNLGVILLERLTEVKVTVYDAVRGKMLGGNDGSLQICSLANSCGATNQGLNSFTDNGPSGTTVLTAFGAPGPSYAVIEVTGYVFATVTIPQVPKEAPGHAWYMPSQNLTPTGAAQLQVGMFGNDVEASDKTAVAHTGIETVTDCTMDGLDMIAAMRDPTTGLYNTSKTNCSAPVCDNINAPAVQVEAPPLRSYVTIQPDTVGICGNGVPTWPIPGQTAVGNIPDIPVWANTTWVNVTPAYATVVGGGWLNFTAGTYVRGNVTVQGTSKAPTGFSVSIQSLNYPNAIAQYAYDPSTTPWATWACGPQPSTGNAFCAPAPPGPGFVTVAANGFPNNYTWVSTPETYSGTPNSVSLGQPENMMLSNVNLTAGGFITGNVSASGSNFGLALAGVDICSVSPTYPVGCSTGSTNLLGQFNFPAPLGWDYVKVSAAGYQPDFIWANVNASQAIIHIGNIGLQPLATLEGRVVDQHGNPVLGATATVCPLTSVAALCRALGAGRVGTDGVYLGTVIGGWLPIATYRVIVSAAGYTTNFAWVNATAGNVTNVSTLVLYASGSNATSVGGLGPAGGPSASGSNGSVISTWVTGRFTDNVSGWGVVTGNFQVCPAQGGVCPTPGTGTNTGGFFNFTVPAGLYYLNVTANGYQTISVFFNSSGAGFLDLGAIGLQPLPWVSGTVVMQPWSLLYIPVSPTKTITMALGPVATVQICTTSRICAPFGGAGSSTAPNGTFLVWGEPGLNDKVSVTPAAPAASTSATGGFNSASTTISISSVTVNTSIPGAIDLPVFASVSFTVMNNLSWQKTLGATPTPVRYASTTIATIGNYTATVGFSANGGGNVTFFIPTGNLAGRTIIGATTPNAWESVSRVLPGTFQPGQAYQADNLSPIHFGWETGIAVATNTYQAAAYLGVSAVSTPVGSASTYSSTSLTNGGGFFNISVAPSTAAKFTVGPGNDFDVATFYANVNYSNTSAYRSVSLFPHNITIDHWGYLSGTQVNYSLFPVATTVVDQAKGLPIWGASVIVSTLGNVESTTTDLPQSNGAGQFFVDAPPGVDWANYSRPVYESNATRETILPGLVTTVTTVHLIGDGVVAGRVVAEPGNIPVANANITDCLAGARVCGLSQTNGTGVFWVNATPGTNFINVTANGFVSAGPTLALVCSDCFIPLTPIPVYEPAYLSGVLRGLPTGLPISKGNVSACSPFGSPTGPCLYGVQTASSGSFTLVIPAGQYTLAFSDPNFNSTYLSLHVAAGQRVNVGTVFLQAFGAVSGAVYDNVSIVPIRGAEVLGCPVWPGPCVAATTDSNGHYLLQGAPGAYTITISASGYQDRVLNAQIVGGTVTVAPTAFLDKLGINANYVVSGTVYADGHVLPGAVVAATTGGAIAASTVTDSNGDFGLTVVYGTYTLLVTAAGEAPLSLPLVVHNPVPGLVLKLATQTYPVFGVVKDGLTGLPLDGVQILVGTTVMYTTNSTGEYNVLLANGTWTLTAQYSGASSVVYGQVQVVVGVEGAGVNRPILLNPIVTIVFGLVVDAASGAPLPGAGITVVGTATDGKKIVETLTASASGAFQLNLPQGSYKVTGVYGGYENQTFSVTPSGASSQLLVPLTSSVTATGHSTSASMGWLAIGVALAAVAAVVVVGAFLALRRKPMKEEKSPPNAGGSA
ncbi:MAG: carboxypeptidase regulatory-like domain-containing protein [Candidatus Lutacidiplasmatales archaeon]